MKVQKQSQYSAVQAPSWVVAPICILNELPNESRITYFWFWDHWRHQVDA